MDKSKWKEKLTTEQFAVCFLGETEPPFSGHYLNNKEEGIYKCVCCEANLFSSKAKFDSGSGWPSYFQPINQNAIKEKMDKSHGMSRTEVQCSQCGSHLGHVFPDGPKPSGLRYCINSLALHFEKSND